MNRRWLCGQGQNWAQKLVCPVRTSRQSLVADPTPAQRARDGLKLDEENEEQAEERLKHAVGGYNKDLAALLVCHHPVRPCHSGFMQTSAYGNVYWLGMVAESITVSDIHSLELNRISRITHVAEARGFEWGCRDGLAIG